MPMARYLAPFAAAMLLVLAVGCGSGKSSAELKAYEAEHPLGPFEDTDGDFSTTDTGLKYRVTREGTGAKPAVTDTVEVHYVGKLVDGTEFDSSYKRQLPTEFPLQKVVAGWTEGMQLVAEGGQIDLIIPSDLGYGPNGGGPIPPDATLYFTVELLDVKQQAQPSDDPSSSDPAIPTSPPSLGPFADTEADGKFSTTASGMMYRITRQGEGKKPKATDTVSVHYAGTFADGKEFDSSYKRDEPTEFPLNGVIRGWTEGLQLVGEGGKIQLIIPSNLAYGPGGRDSIPPNSTLYFTVELLKIKP
ncbi:MAG: hypothetical protein HON53_17905 [Planctomycetaceae bacterium]|jgi:FKBP-type peptidyl-prolyl cis-trans isomerase|nr:hypothetical protein [Planctomycetaceae bacterium]MBT6155575.1 hypothetical protein [Planctomycetaceae bacterium]MBT6485824.1 hypothetical protein [Planctomycetaceae bacterium]MBT6496234.1 hypothetical protein [Planctomycetaceae bacterium]